MRKALFAATALALVALFVGGAAGGDRHKYEPQTVVDESFDVENGWELWVQVGDVDVDVEPGADGRARVVVEVSGPDEDDAMEYFEKLDFRTRLDGDRVVVETREHRARFFSFSWNGHNRVRVHAVITVPRRFDIDVATSDGDLSADGIDGDISLKTSDGDVELGKLHGASIYVKSSDGDIHAGELVGEEVTFRTSDGDLSADRIEAGDLLLRTSDGNVTVHEVKGGRIQVHSSDGDIELSAAGEELEVRTSDGDIEADISSEMTVDLTTSDGDIELRAPADLKADLNLRGGRVRISGKANLTDGNVGKRQITGKLNTGGPRVRARSGDGRIVLVLK
jgi:DUF4097 and DUF4098 domain-containing protein YvlB